MCSLYHLLLNVFCISQRFGRLLVSQKTIIYRICGEMIREAAKRSDKDVSIHGLVYVAC